MGGVLVIPLVALVIPILLVVGVVVLDAMFFSWFAYHLWHDRKRGSLRRLLHRSG